MITPQVSLDTASSGRLQALKIPFACSNTSDLAKLHLVWPAQAEAGVILDAYCEHPFHLTIDIILLILEDNKVEWMYAPTDSGAVRLAMSEIFAADSISLGLRRIHPHRLATLSLTIALGIIFTHSQHDRAFLLFSAASSLLTLSSSHHLTEPTIASVEALHLMVTFLFATGQADSVRAAWPLLGSCMRLASALGLHRDCGKWGIVGEDKAHRETLAWECITYDVL